MSSKKTRTETTQEQSIIVTRARTRAQKLSNMYEDVTTPSEKVKLQKKKKSTTLKDKNNLDVSVAGIESTDVMLSKSVKKKGSRRKLKVVKGTETENRDTMHKDVSISSNDSNRELKDKHSDNIKTKSVRDNLAQSSNLDSIRNKTPKKRQREAVVADMKITSSTVTPKCSPIKLIITPHRSTKTPKKSPISLGSPKTHSLTASKLLKSPRKLYLTPEQNLDRSNNNSQDGKLRKNKSNSSPDKSSPGSVRRSKHNSNKLSSHKYSKSPKIVLKSPKSKKMKSKLRLLSPARIRKRSLKRSLMGTTPSPDLNVIKSLEISKKKISLKDGNLSTFKRRWLSLRLIKTLTASQIHDILAEPMVLLERLSLESMQASIENNSEMLTQTVKKTRSNMHVRRTHGSSANNSTKSPNKSSSIKHDTLILGKNKKSLSLTSSTPQDKASSVNISLSSNTLFISDDESPYTRSRHKNQSIMQLSGIMDNSKTSENLSKYSLLHKVVINTSQTYPLDITKQDATFNLNENEAVSEKEQENKKDTTYELKQPQTSSLRQIVDKHTKMDRLPVTAANIKEDAKRSYKVRFTNPMSDKNDVYKSVNQSIGLGSRTSCNNGVQRNTVMNAACKPENKISKFSQNLSSLSKVNPMMSRVTPKVQLDKKLNRFNTMIPILSISRVQTPKSLASVEKSGKKSSVKKVPNFGKIHERLFAKSESLVDAKKRLENRYMALAAKKASPKVNITKEKKSLPTDASNDTHNRFGFKLKKSEATHIILKKQTYFSRQKQQHETRMVLKGVRTNRRFEMQMKSRNINA